MDQWQEMEDERPRNGRRNLKSSVRDLSRDARNYVITSYHVKFPFTSLFSQKKIEVHSDFF